MAEHEPPTQHPPSAGLGGFIRAHRDRILAEWARATRLLPCAKGLTHPALLNHMPGLLDGVAEVLEGRQSRGTPLLGGLPEVHALSRLDSGFNPEQVAGEYALLRTCVLRLYREHVEHTGGAPEGARMLREVELFHRQMDEAIGTAVAHYSRARERTLVALDRLSEEAAGTGDLDAFLPRLLRVLMETTEAVDSVAVLLREDGRLRVRAAVGLEADVAEGFSVALGEGFAGRVAARRRPLEVRSASTDPRLESPALHARGTRALYGVPLLHEGDVIGVAHMGSRTAFEFSREDKLLFRAMTSRATGLLIQHRLVERERAAREALEARERLLEAVLARAPAAVALLDTRLRYVRVNEAMAAANGLPVEAHPGRTVDEVIPDRAARVSPVLRRVLETGETVRGVEFTAPSAREPGTVHHWVGDYFPVRTPDGQMHGVAGIIVEITEHKRHEEELRRTAEFRERFVGIVSHDLRNPLNAILLSANALLRAEDVGERHLKAIRRIATSAERMTRMIGDLLDFTRGRLGGGIPISPKPCNLRQVCRQVLDELEVAYPERTLRLVSHGDFNGEWDPDRLAQLLGNLGKNALDYSPEGTTVDVVLCDEGDSVHVSLRNRGAPIAPELLPHLFEPFRRGESEERSGLGLGLFIAREVVLAHGGTIEARSEQGYGTVFLVRLPRHSPRL